MTTQQTTLVGGKESTVHEIFQKTLDKTHHWLKDIKVECGLNDVHQAYTLLRAVLFTIRDRAPIGDAVNFAAQLPMLVRGFYYEGWIPFSTPDKDIRTKQHFFDSVLLHVGNRPGALGVDIERKTMGVFKVLAKYINAPEMKKLENVMPHDLKDLFHLSSGAQPVVAQTTTQASA